VASHPFDPVSFVLGLLAGAAGLVVLFGGELIEQAKILLPLGLISFGVAVLARLGDARTD
jgi:hypothetical protein